MKKPIFDVTRYRIHRRLADKWNGEPNGANQVRFRGKFKGLSAHHRVVHEMNEVSLSRSRPSPHEVTMMIFLAFSSTSIVLFGKGVPNSVAAVLDPPATVAWSIMLGVGSMVTLIGVAWRGRYITALGIERVGLILHTAACLVYVVALVANASAYNNTAIATSFIGAVAVANIWKIVRLTLATQRILFLSRQIAEGEGE